jgi:hypothetical protein
LALACESTVLVNLSYGDLDRCVILGLDDAVGCAALAGDVAVIKSVSIVSVIDATSEETHRSTSSPLSFSMFADFFTV